MKNGSRQKFTSSTEAAASFDAHVAEAFIHPVRRHDGHQKEFASLSLFSSWPGIAVRRTASLPLAFPGHPRLSWVKRRVRRGCPAAVYAEASTGSMPVRRSFSEGGHKAGHDELAGKSNSIGCISSQVPRRTVIRPRIRSEGMFPASPRLSMMELPHLSGVASNQEERGRNLQWPT